MGITGAKEAMQAARAKIENISQNQLARHRESFEAPLWTHPFIRGGNDSRIKELQEKYKIGKAQFIPEFRDFFRNREKISTFLKNSCVESNFSYLKTPKFSGLK